MNARALVAAIDAVATAEPERSGYGYADTQHVFRHVPAIDHARSAVQDFLEHVRAMGLRGTFVVVGDPTRGGMQRALRLLAARVVTVTEAATVAARLRDDAVGTDDLVIEGSLERDDVLTAARAAVASCDLLLLDGGCDYAQRRADWERLAPLVRPGGLVAMVDRSHAMPGATPFGIDRLVADLGRDWLAPRGVRWLRFGSARAIHGYVQPTDRDPAGVPWPRGFAAPAAPRRLGDSAGLAMFAWGDRCIAVPDDGRTPTVASLAQNEHEVVLQAASPAALTDLVVAFTAAETATTTARALLRDGRAAEAEAAARAVLATRPGLRAALVPSIEAAPFCRRTLQVAGTLAVFDGEPRQGAALLHAALRTDMLDRELLQALATVLLRVVGDEAAARRLLVECQRYVRSRRLASVCHGRLTGHVLWQFPQLLEDVHGVLQVGAHTGEEVAAWAELGIAAQCYLEPHPAAFAQLQRTCAEHGRGEILTLAVAVGAQAGTGELRCGDRSLHASLLPTHALARVDAADQQRTRVPVPVATLDDLCAQGRIDPRRYNLLFVDAEGMELEVLRGARAMLAHVDVIAVSVFDAEIYEGAPMPTQLQIWLRELGDDAFVLRAFEPGAEPGRGDAVFRRLRARGGRR